MQNFATWIQIALLFILKLIMFRKILQMMLKKYLAHLILKSVGHYLQEKIKKVIGLMKDDLVAKITTEFVALRPKD